MRNRREWEEEWEAEEEEEESAITNDKGGVMVGEQKWPPEAVLAINTPPLPLFRLLNSIPPLHLGHHLLPSHLHPQGTAKAPPPPPSFAATTKFAQTR